MPRPHRSVLFAVALAFQVASGRDFVVTGVADPPPDRIAAALDADDDLLLLVGPVTPRAAFLSAVADKAALAMQHAGHPDATATASDAAGADGTRILVEVAAGPRVVAGDIAVAGFPDEAAADLRRWLTEPRPEADERHRLRPTASGTTVWVDADDQPVDLDPPLWTPGSPAPCDPHQLPTLRAAVASFLRDRGWYAAARDLETAGRLCSCDVTIDRAAGRATLTVAATAPLRRAALREIIVDPPAAVPAPALGIEEGTPVGETDRLAWRDALCASGRFTRQDVTFREVAGDTDDDVGIVATFSLRPYGRVPTLGTPLTRAEATLLRCRGWLLAALADGDLVIHWTRPDAEFPVATFGMSSRDGVLLVAAPEGDACGMALGAGLGWFLPHGAGRCEVPLPAASRAVLAVGLALDAEPNAADGRHARNLTVSAGVHSHRRPHQASVTLAARLDPVACLSLAHEDGASTRWDDDVLVIDVRGTELRIDAPTGRLVALRLPGGDRLDVAAEDGFVATATAALRRSSGADGFRPAAPLTSLVDFLTDDAMATAVVRVADDVGLGGLLAAWRPVAATIAHHVRLTATRDGFIDVDRHLAHGLAAESDRDPLPVIPAARRRDPPADPLLTAATVVALAGARWLEGTIGAESWPASLVRIATRIARRDTTTALVEAAAFTADSRTGPLAHLLAARLVPVPTLAAAFARQGASRLSTDAFHADCVPLLRAGRASGLDRCLVTLLRTLDDDQVRGCGAALGDREGLVALVDRLRSHSGDDTAVQDLAAALDAWWETSLQWTVAATLAGGAEDRVADRNEPRRR